MCPMQGSGSAAQGEISFLSWNSKVQHILASTSYNGTTGEDKNRIFKLLVFYLLLFVMCSIFFFPVVWDLKKQKPVIR